MKRSEIEGGYTYAKGFIKYVNSGRLYPEEIQYPEDLLLYATKKVTVRPEKKAAFYYWEILDNFGGMIEI